MLQKVEGGKRKKNKNRRIREIRFRFIDNKKNSFRQFIEESEFGDTKV